MKTLSKKIKNMFSAFEHGELHTLDFLRPKLMADLVAQQTLQDYLAECSRASCTRTSQGTTTAFATSAVHSRPT
jgi:hypothetical protein